MYPRYPNNSLPLLKNKQFKIKQGSNIKNEVYKKIKNDFLLRKNKGKKLHIYNADLTNQETETYIVSQIKPVLCMAWGARLPTLS